MPLSYIFSFSDVSSSSKIAAEAPDTAAITAITAPSTATPMIHPIKINTPVSDIVVHLLSTYNPSIIFTYEYYNISPKNWKDTSKKVLSIFISPSIYASLKTSILHTSTIDLPPLDIHSYCIIILKLLSSSSSAKNLKFFAKLSLSLTILML